MSESDDNGDNGDTQVTFHDLYASIVFLSGIYVAGLVFARVFKMPSLVGEILCGILLGPNFLEFVPNVNAFSILGEIGLTLSVLEAGIDIDLTTLKLIGANGVLIAVVGTILPVSLAAGIALLLGYRGVEALSAGCSFAPTSLGIAMSVLRQANIANTPVGQLVVAAAIIDDMIALVILSQLETFSNGEVTVADVVVPIVCALVFLLFGGYLAIFVMPQILNLFVLNSLPKRIGFSRNWVALGMTILLLLALLPAAYYSKVSPLLGAFLAGLVFCSDSGAHHMFVTQFKRVNQWLLRIFFAASIGFQVPLPRFANPTVLWHGFAFALALLGKIAVGFMTPNLTLTRRFKDLHLRDCLVVSFSMASEGEFAFVIAAYSVNHGMITRDLYASIVLAVLLSTIVAPFCLRSTISCYNKRVQDSLLSVLGNPISILEEGIRDQSAVFYCVQTKSGPAWGMHSKIMLALRSLELDVIDHRAWHLRQSNSLVANEIYARDACDAFQTKDKQKIESQLSGRITDIRIFLEGVIGQDDAVVKVKRWFPEPLLPDSDDASVGSDISERMVRATGAALIKSMENSSREKYTQMVDRTENIGAPDDLDEVFAGRLDGLIRRDRTRVVPSKEGIELLDMRGVALPGRRVAR